MRPMRRRRAQARPVSRSWENAGRAVAHAIVRRWAPRPVAVLCGPGNNGGDGFVAARLLAEAGWPVRLGLLVPRERLKGDAAAMAERWEHPVEPLDLSLLKGEPLVVDALFGAGLARPLEGVALALAKACAARDLPCVAVDMPSGVHGDTGEALGESFKAALTVTFGRRKYGHLLLPGRERAGEVVVADIGIPEAAVGELALRVHENAPALWQALLPGPGASDHKYSRGHALAVWRRRRAFRRGAACGPRGAPHRCRTGHRPCARGRAARLCRSADRRHARVPGRSGGRACRRAPQRAADRPRLRREPGDPRADAPGARRRGSAASSTPMP